jgi:hypothetical protein
MTRFQISLLAFALMIGAGGFSAEVAAAENLRCTYTLGQYTQYAKQLGSFADRAHRQADDNPLYQSDVAYYRAELADAQQCIKNLAPIGPTASR